MSYYKRQKPVSAPAGTYPRSVEISLGDDFSNATASLVNPGKGLYTLSMEGTTVAENVPHKRVEQLEEFSKAGQHDRASAGIALLSMTHHR